MSTRDDLERELAQTGDLGVARALWDLYMEAGEDPTPPLEREWKRKRDPVITSMLTRFYEVSKRDPEEQFERLKREVSRQVWVHQLEELAGEHGNFDREPWKVNELTAERPQAYTWMRPEERAAIEFRADRNIVAPDGMELWVVDDTIHRHQPVERFPVLDYPPEHWQRELEHEYGRDAQFVTTYTHEQEDDEYLQDTNTGEVYRRVETETFGERECPLATWNSEEREDATENAVKESDTWYGEEPGKHCMLCGERIGEEHGYIDGTYDVGNVYVKLEPRVPRETIDDPNIEQEVLRTFENDFDVGEDDLVDVFYEHGRWFVRHTVYGERGEDDVERTYSVVDVEVAGGQFQFDFEEV